jgi:hypothetical protein
MPSALKNYFSLREILREDSVTKYDVLAVLTSFSGPKRNNPNASDKYSATYTLTDNSLQSNSSQRNVVLNVFGQNVGDFPTGLAIGDIMIFNNVKKNRYRESLQLIGNLRWSAFTVIHETVQFETGVHSIKTVPVGASDTPSLSQCEKITCQPYDDSDITLEVTFSRTVTPAINNRNYKNFLKDAEALLLWIKAYLLNNSVLGDSDAVTPIGTLQERMKRGIAIERTDMVCLVVAVIDYPDNIISAAGEHAAQDLNSPYCSRLYLWDGSVPCGCLFDEELVQQQHSAANAESTLSKIPLDIQERNRGGLVTLDTDALANVSMSFNAAKKYFHGRRRRHDTAVDGENLDEMNNQSELERAIAGNDGKLDLKVLADMLTGLQEEIEKSIPCTAFGVKVAKPALNDYVRQLRPGMWVTLRGLQVNIDMQQEPFGPQAVAVGVPLSEIQAKSLPSTLLIGKIMPDTHVCPLYPYYQDVANQVADHLVVVARKDAALAAVTNAINAGVPSVAEAGARTAGRENQANEANLQQNQQGEQPTNQPAQQRSGSKQTDFTSICLLHGSPVPGKFQCRGRIISYWPQDIHKFVIAREIEKGRKQNKKRKHGAGDEENDDEEGDSDMVYNYMFSICIEDNTKTGRIDLIVQGAEAKNFLGGVSAKSFAKDKELQKRVKDCLDMHIKKDLNVVVRIVTYHLSPTKEQMASLGVGAGRHRDPDEKRAALVDSVLPMQDGMSPPSKTSTPSGETDSR